MRQIILFLLIGFLSQAGFGQTRTITGTVLDSITHTPLTNVTLLVKNARHGAVTNAEGRFSIRVENNATHLVFSIQGYDPVTLLIPDPSSQPLTVLMSKTFTTLKEYVITAKPGRYRNKNNPSVELIRRVIANKRLNGPKAPAYNSFRQYEKIRLLIDKTPPPHRR